MNKTHVPVFGINLQTLRPRGFGPTSSSVGVVHEAYDANMLHALSACYLDPFVASSLKTWVLEVLRHYESFPNPTSAIMPPTNSTLVPLGNSTKETLVSQFVWCETLRPRGFGPISSFVSGVHEAYDANMLHALYAYYQDPSLKTWALEMLHYYESFLNPTGAIMPPTNPALTPFGNSTREATVSQSMWCEVCMVEYNTKKVLDKHKMGKKQKKNEEKMKESITPPPPADLGVSVNPLIES
ncbi:hypothetical protein Vadar_028627 [Vaccinium darrowii]|uniref:Uncharacterized protein n=1 Tax=Vaccinium darrowii TaxID=229202 RepID=A0ACB7XKY8_9ERIC|nr:hypothetical protein Vadar_028627 [Vaccinium darrowii]